MPFGRVCGLQVCDLAVALFPNGPALTCDTKGVYVMLRMLQALRKRLGQVEGMARIRACDAASQLCEAFLAEPDKLRHCCHNYQGSKVLVEAVSIGLPRFGALRLGSSLAASASKLIATKHGINVLTALANGLGALELTCDELVRDMLVSMALKLQGRYSDLVLGINSDDRGPALVRQLLVRLSEEQVRHR